MLEVKKINKKFKHFSLQDITFSLPAGYIMGYVGQNGAGKTTTLNIITNLLKADSGEIRVNGMTYMQNPIGYKDVIGFIGDESYFPQEFRIKDLRKTLKDFYPSFQEEKFMEMVKLWELPEDKKIHEYSKGMKVKLMFAGVLSRDTKLLILDEATSGLDPVVRNDVLSLLQRYISDGERSVIFSTHILTDLEQIADYIFFINDGKMVMCDTKDEIIEKYVLVKGGLEDLTKDLKKNLIGIMNSNVGFTALAESEKALYLKKGLLIEKPTIDNIVIHYIKESGGSKLL